jgi:hypothetical protein
MPRRPASYTAWIGTASGVTLGLAGLLQARRLAQGDGTALQRSAATSGPARIAFGTLLLIKPRLLPRSVGATSGGEAAPLLARMIAVREVVAGIGLLSASRADSDPRPSLLSLAAVDGSEGIVVLHALVRRRLPAIPALGFAVADLGGAMVGAGLFVRRRRGGHVVRRAGRVDLT